MTQTVSPQFPIRATFASQTRPGVTYTVTIHADGDVLCTCPAGRHKRLCWHLTRAMADAKPAPDYAANRAKRRPWVEELDTMPGRAVPS